MVQLAAWLTACLVLAWATRRLVSYGVAAVILVWSLIPAVGGHHVIGIASNAIAFHPATWLVLCLFGMQLLVNPRALGAALARHYLVILTVPVFAVGALLTSVATGSGGTRLLLDQVVGPFLLWWLIVAAGTGDRRFLVVVRAALIGAMAAQSGLAIIQLLRGEILFFAGDYEQLAWFKPETFVRWMGTTDSPLVLSLGVCVAGALAVGLRSNLLRFSLLGLFLVATVITQSRTGTAVLSVIIVYAIVRSQMALWARLLASFCVVLLGSYLVGSTIFAGLASRFADDTGSANARVLALQFVFGNAGDFLLTGQGLTASYDIARNAGLETSLENSYLMYVIDTGFVLATLYFGCQLAIVARYGWQRSVRGATLAAVVATLLQHTFSATAFANLSGTLIWTALGLLVVAWTLPVDERSRSAVHHLEASHSSLGAPASARSATSAGP